jgi:hypothetical protein
VKIKDIPIWSKTKKPLIIALSGTGWGGWGRNKGGNVTNVQYKSNQNCHYESPLYNEHMLIKKKLEALTFGTIFLMAPND